MVSSASDKAKSFAKSFSKNSNLDDWVISLPTFRSTLFFINNLFLAVSPTLFSYLISLPVFPSTTNMKL